MIHTRSDKGVCNIQTQTRLMRGNQILDRACYESRQVCRLVSSSSFLLLSCQYIQAAALLKLRGRGERCISLPPNLCSQSAPEMKGAFCKAPCMTAATQHFLRKLYKLTLSRTAKVSAVVQQKSASLPST